MTSERVRRGAGLLLVAVAWGLPLAACSSGKGSATITVDTAVRTTTPLRVDQLPAAVKAVEAKLGGPQRYTEINAIPQGVNLFVVDGDKERSWFFEGGLQDPGAPQPLGGTPFALDGVDLSVPQRVIPDVQRRFPGSEVVTASLLVIPNQGLSWALQSRSALGGVLQLVYTPTGTLVSASPADDTASSTASASALVSTGAPRVGPTVTTSTASAPTSTTGG